MCDRVSIYELSRWRYGVGCARRLFDHVHCVFIVRLLCVHISPPRRFGVFAYNYRPVYRTQPLCCPAPPERAPNAIPRASDCTKFSTIRSLHSIHKRIPHASGKSFRREKQETGEEHTVSEPCASDESHVDTDSQRCM